MREEGEARTREEGERREEERRGEERKEVKRENGIYDGRVQSWWAIGRSIELLDVAGKCDGKKGGRRNEEEG